MSYKKKAIEAVRKMLDIDGYRCGDAVSRCAVISVLDLIEEEAPYITIGEHGICVRHACSKCAISDSKSNTEEDQ